MVGPASRFDAGRRLVARFRASEVVGPNGAATILLASLDRCGEHLVDFFGDGGNEVAVGSHAGISDHILDLAGDDDDFLGLVGLCHGCFLPE